MDGTAVNLEVLATQQQAGNHNAAAANALYALLLLLVLIVLWQGGGAANESFTGWYRGMQGVLLAQRLLLNKTTPLIQEQTIPVERQE